MKRAPWVDVVFGTHNIGKLPVLLERARVQEEAQVEIAESLEAFPSTLPTRRESAYAAWVSISVGCNNTCTFCIVPALRGKEKDRRPGDILAEIEALVAEGVSEITLLGQNVNAYGSDIGDREAFSKLLRACGRIDGLERVRFTSPHPRDFTDDVIAAMAETPNVMPQLHMPLQSGSDPVLKAMRRTYTRERYMDRVALIREHVPDVALTTDIIVGFPGESEADFKATLKLVDEIGFAQAFSFKYSIRPGTPGAAMENQVPEAVKDERLQRLQALLNAQQIAFNRGMIGRVLPVLLNIVGSTCLLVWTISLVSQLILRRRADRAGTPLPFRMRGFPWLTGAALAILAARRLKKAQSVLGAARAMRSLLDAAPARAMLVHADGKVEADALLVQELGLPKAPHRLGELAGDGHGFVREDLDALGPALDDVRLGGAEVRLRAAVVRLAEGQAVTVVAHELGFGSASAFIRDFRLATGVTPKRWFRPAAPGSGPAMRETPGTAAPPSGNDGGHRKTAGGRRP